MTLKRRLNRLEKKTTCRQASVKITGRAFVWTASEKSMEWPFAVPSPPVVWPLQQGAGLHAG